MLFYLFFSASLDTVIFPPVYCLTFCLWFRIVVKGATIVSGWWKTTSFAPQTSFYVSPRVPVSPHIPSCLPCPPVPSCTPCYTSPLAPPCAQVPPYPSSPPAPHVIWIKASPLVIQGTLVLHKYVNIQYINTSFTQMCTPVQLVNITIIFKVF